MGFLFALEQEMEKSIRTSVIVFIKNPELGKVKTRLAQSIGDHKALEVYMKLMDHTNKVLLDVENAERYVYYSTFVDRQDDWNTESYIKGLQSAGDLGDRIKAAFTEVFDQCDRAIIIGSDCPQLKPEHIHEAIEKLNTHNLVIGPSLDGGYYLLGIDKYYPYLFEDIEWSTETVLERTLDKAHTKGLSSYRLESLSDVDYIEDWEKYGFD